MRGSARTVSASIDVGSGYKRLSGTQDPTVNNGQTQSTVTLPARSGLIMVRTSTSCTSVSAGSAALNWTPPSAAVKGYRVYYGRASRDYDQPRGSGMFVTSAAYAVSGLSAGSTYYFAVTSVATDGRESAYSGEVSKTIR